MTQDSNVGIMKSSFIAFPFFYQKEHHTSLPFGVLLKADLDTAAIKHMALELCTASTAKM